MAPCCGRRKGLGLSLGLTVFAALLVPVWPQSEPAVNCTVPPAAQNITLTCNTSTGGASLQDAAVRFAPVVHFHPLETYYLEDPAVYFDSATLHGARAPLSGLSPTNATLQAAASGPLAYQSLERTFITVLDGARGASAQLRAGAPLDAAGRSTAVVYYNVVDLGSGGLLYNYNLYYTYNGCGKFILGLAHDGAYQGIKFQACPVGAHEGDWERVTVAVCPGGTTPAAVTYSQHGWQMTLDCTLGGCPLQGSHPVVYSALGSHANYPTASPLNLYSLTRLNFLANLDGLYVGDLSAADPNRTFVPTPDNILPLPEVGSGNFSAEDAWAAYPGAWGERAVLVTSTGFQVTCFLNNDTQIGPCPQSLPFQALSVALGLTGSDVDNRSSILPPGVAQVIRDAINATNLFESPGPTGPWQRDWSYQRVEDTSAPIYREVNVTALGSQICPFTGDPSVTARVPVDISGTNVADYVLGLAIAILVFSVGLAVAFLLPACLRTCWRRRACWGKWACCARKRLVTRSDSDADTGPLASSVPLVLDPAMQPLLAQGRPATPMLVPASTANALFPRTLWAAAGTGMYIAGGVLLGVGTASLVDALNQVSHDNLWSTLQTLLIVVLCLIGALDLIAVIVYLFLTLEPGFTCCNRYSMKNPASYKYLRHLQRSSHAMHMTLVAICCLVISLAMMAFGFGLIVGVGRILLVNTCERVATVVTSTGICLNLQRNGLDYVACGQNIVALCNEWNNLNVNDISIGAALVLWAHLIFVILALMQAHLTRTYHVPPEAAQQLAEAVMQGHEVLAPATANGRRMEPAVVKEMMKV